MALGRLRLARREEGRLDSACLAAWYAIGAVIVFLLPVQLRLRQPVWRLPAPELPQCFIAVAAYLALVMLLLVASRRSSRTIIPSAAAGSIACFGLAYEFLRARPDVAQSRIVFVLSAVLGVALALLPFLLGGARPTGVTMLAVGSAAVAGVGVRSPRRADDGDTGNGVFVTALNSVDVRHYPGLITPIRGDGGGLTRHEDGLLLVTGDGDFYRLRWDTAGTLRAEPLDLPAPMDHDAYLADQPDRARAPRLRVTDITVDTSTVPARLVVAHQWWSHEGRCFTLRVSTLSLAASPKTVADPGRAWKPIFETRPCLPLTPGFDDVETGGRLAWDQRGRLLLSVGDLGFNGVAGPDLPQDMTADYGKVLRLDLAGGREIVSWGHRNPQGLTVDRMGKIWVSEHGPRGGDELNLVVQGRNYGWPLATYGTEYGADYWPLAPGVRDHGPFAEPAYAFVPSVGISNLIQLNDSRFRVWNGDLLVGSLRLQTLYRVRTRDDRVIYVEPFRIGRRIRDLEESNGRVVLWTDEGDIVVLARPAGTRPATTLFGRCAGCHEPAEGVAASAPPLRGIVGERVAAMTRYPYSAALAALGGQWTEERLDAFLRDPAAYAPGTTMRFGGLSSPAERSALIELLRHHQ